MINSKVPKATSYSYGHDYQLEQIEKHRSRHINHWQPRIALAHKLIDQYVLPRFVNRLPNSIQVLDVGCSIGTMAIEMASRGFRTYGVDFDASAIAIAKKLCLEEGVTIEFHQGDVAEWGDTLGLKFDFALCFDIFEHLHDDELGAMLQSIRRQLSDEGALVFHTYPLQYDYIFFSRKIITLPLYPFRKLSPECFERIVKVYALVIDMVLLMSTGKTYRERNEKIAHCNPTTKERLNIILQRAGYEVTFIETDNIFPFHIKIKKQFLGLPISHRNLYGVAYPKKRD
jgi:2-polyprenyl-3-methyl-5-hydroxy-6-metoxy-1,4-benzoquinol methylase